MKPILLALFTISCLLFTGCIDNNGAFPLPTSKEIETGGTPAFTGDYQPFTAGSTWTYRSFVINPFIPSQSVTETSVVTMTAETRTLNGRILRRLTTQTSTDADECFIGTINNVYFFRNEGIINDQGATEIPYLNDKLNAGQSFNTSIVPFAGSSEMRFVTTIAEKGISKVILSKTYADVIHTSVQVQSKTNGVWVTEATYEFYVAKNIGLISISVSSQGTLIATEELVSHNIK